MEWQTFFTVINTADTVLGLLFLATSWLVGRSWMRSRRAQARGEAVGAAPAPEAPPDAAAWSDVREGL